MKKIMQETIMQYSVGAPRNIDVARGGLEVHVSSQLFRTYNHFVP